MRNITLYKLNKLLSIKTHSFLSTKGDKIFVLMHADEEVLKNEAERIDFNLQFEVGATDFLSLEPCDEKLRPYLFTKQSKPSYITDLEKTLEDFHKMFYEQDYQHLMNQHISEPAQVSEKEWQTYKTFLEYINTKKAEVRSLIQKNKQLTGFFFRVLYSKAMHHAYKFSGKRLKNIWNDFGTKFIGAYYSYFRDVDQITGIDWPNGISLYNSRFLEKAFSRR